MPGTIRVRFGFKNLIPIFKNAGVFVINTDQPTFVKLSGFTDEIKSLLQIAGQKAIADKLICEKSN